MAKSNSGVQKLNRERRTWGVLDHRNILPLYGFADDEEMFQPFGALISPWLQRGDASRFFAEHGDAFTIDQRINLWEDVLSGVIYLHSYKPLLVHGDLKPRNILIDDYGRAQICDFGLVRIFLEEGSSGMTTTTYHTGTERYLAYELVIAGEEAIPTTASDVYAVGCIGLEFIFSQVPYSTRKNNYGGMICVDIRNGIAPAERPSDLSSYLEVLWVNLDRCWDKDPSKRPTAYHLKFALEWLDVTCQGGETLWDGYNANLATSYFQDATSFFASDSDDGLEEDMESASLPESPVNSYPSQFTPDQQAAAQKIYAHLKVHPNFPIPASLIAPPLFETDEGDAWGWCLIGQCGLDKAAEKVAARSGEQIDDSKRRIDHLYDHIRVEHFKNGPFQSSVPAGEQSPSHKPGLKLPALPPCEFCSKVYMSADDLRRHVHLKHWEFMSSDRRPRSIT